MGTKYVGSRTEAGRYRHEIVMHEHHDPRMEKATERLFSEDSILLRREQLNREAEEEREHRQGERHALLENKVRPRAQRAGSASYRGLNGSRTKE